MVTPEEILELIRDIESDRVERTVSTTDTDKFGEAICAFANDFPRHRAPGYLIMGAKNDGQLSGLRVTDQLLQNLAAIRSDGNVQPLPALTVNRFSFPEGDVAVLQVLPSDLPPVRYKGKVWIRVGPRRGTANEQEERLLSERRVALAKSFDALPCLGASLSDISVPLFEGYRQEAIAPEIIEENHRRTEEQLASLRFFNLDRNTPTNAGLILFGKNPRFFLPGDYIQYLLLPADELTDLPRDQEEISGDLITVLRDLDTRIKVLNPRALEATSVLQEIVTTDYPDGAIRELLMNAIIHRNYESNTPVRFYWFRDRIEIHSPGGLYGEVTSENYTRQSSYRNPVLAEAMKVLGYVNRFGYGIQKAQKLLQANGNPPAEFEFNPQSVLVTIRKRS